MKYSDKNLIEIHEFLFEHFKKETDNLFYITSLDEKVSGKISKEQIDNLSCKFNVQQLNLIESWSYKIKVFIIFNSTNKNYHLLLKYLKQVSQFLRLYFFFVYYFI